MFNNIIYFIIVILVFNISPQEVPPEDSFLYAAAMFLLTFLACAAYCRWEFLSLLRRAKADGEREEGFAGQYHKVVLRLSILSIFLFVLDVHLFHLKYWIQRLPGIGSLSVLQGIVGIAVFLIYLILIWHFSHPAYQEIFQTTVARRAYILSNFKLNVPILFPWIMLSLVYELISLMPWARSVLFTDNPGGHILFFSFFLILLMIFMPRLIQYWWGCKPLEVSEKVKSLKDFLREKGFRFRDLLNWPIFEGRLLSAGIMGIIPRFRYILVTQALMEALSTEELKAVMAHEMGHAKHRHLLFYLFFFLGFMAISFGLFDIFFYYLATHPFFTGILVDGKSEASNLFYLLLALPILLTMFIYFRYVMGFFMRQFERQADLYSAVAMGSPENTINSLEKIALLSGKVRDLPSWHHFSIKERVDCLWRALKNPRIVRRHNRFVALSLGVYLVIMTGLGYLLNFSPLKENIIFRLVARGLQQEMVDEPNNPLVYQNLAIIYHRLGDYQEAIKAYDKILALDQNQAVALNNLAWILVTVPDERLRDKERALALAKRAVAIERSPVYLDTLAEALYVNGFVSEAVRAIEEAISLATEGSGYYEKQLERFRGKG